MRIPRTTPSLILLAALAYGSETKVFASPQATNILHPDQTESQDRSGGRVDSSHCRSSAAMRSADHLLLLGQYPQAILLMKRMSKCNPQDLAVREKLMVAYLKNNQKQKALSEANSAAEGSSADEVISIARVLNANNEFVGAETVLKGGSDAADQHAGIHGEMGVALLGQGKYEEAVRELGVAVQLDGSSAQYSLELARGLLSWGNYPTALAFLNAVGDRFSYDSMYLYEKAWAYYGIGRFADSVDILHELVEKEPNWDLAQYSLGNAYSMQGDLKNALLRYRAAIKLNGKSSAYYTALGRVLRRRDGTLPEAISSLNKAIALEPHNVQAEFELALAFKYRREYQKSKKLLEDVTSRKPDMIDAHRVLGLVYYQLRSPDEGAKQMAIATELEAAARQKAAAAAHTGEDLAYK